MSRRSRTPDSGEFETTTGPGTSGADDSTPETLASVFRFIGIVPE
jgi:hypothetical protein